MKVQVRKRGTLPAAGKCERKTEKWTRAVRTMFSPIRTWAESFCVAFSLYSAIPMPKVNWTKDNMKYAFCFFPLVGAAIGLAMMIWLRICILLEQPAVFAAGAAALPVLLTGGIHMDGFCDAMDAMGSHGGPEKRLEIMKDSRSGAFAIMGCALYILMSYALWRAFYEYPTGAVCFVFVLSRALSGLGVTRFPCAKGSGLAASFSSAAEKRTVTAVLCVYAAMSVLWMGAFTPVGAVLCITAACCFLMFYGDRSKRLFGGITGDLAGWFLELCELLQLGLLVLAQVWACA